MPASVPLMHDGACPAVLIVEDDRLLRRMLVETLQAEGWPAIEADGAIQGLEQLRRFPTLRFLITDINMPGMSGSELLEVVEIDFPAVRAIAVSGRAAASAGLVPDSVTFLAKPFTAQQLIAEVRRRFGEDPAAGGPPGASRGSEEAPMHG